MDTWVHDINHAVNLELNFLSTCILEISNLSIILLWIRKASLRNIAYLVNNAETKHPVLLQALYISNSNGKYLGTLLDIFSTDEYVTYKYAKKH